MKIGIDVDEVVCEFVKDYVNFLNKKTGKSISYEDVVDWDIAKIFQITREEERAENIEFIQQRKHINLKLVEGAGAAIIQLSKENQIFFITARPLIIKEDTEIYLKKAFPEVNFKIYHSDDHWPNKTKKKSEICTELRLDFMIDDNPDFLESCSRKGIKYILFNKPWNKHIAHENIKRVNDWKEVLASIK